MAARNSTGARRAHSKRRRVPEQPHLVKPVPVSAAEAADDFDAVETVYELFQVDALIDAARTLIHATDATDVDTDDGARLQNAKRVLGMASDRVKEIANAVDAAALRQAQARGANDQEAL